MRVSIKTDSRERYIGDYNAKKNLFYKEVSGSRHLFRVLDAWGIDGYYFTEVLLPKKATIQIYDKETNEDYTISALNYQKHSQYYHFKNKAEDNRPQIFCPRRNWEVKKREPKVEQTEEDRIKQLAESGVF